MTSLAPSRPGAARARSPSPTRRADDAGLSVSTSSSSAGAALTRSVLLFMGIMFRRPSKLFRPNRVDTWGALRHLAVSADQTLSPGFIRTILKAKGGSLALAAAVVPPLLINTALGFLLFTSHSLFSLGLARLPFFQRRVHGEGGPPARGPLGARDGDSDEAVLPGQSSDDADEDAITLETLIRGPSVVPRHPTILSALAGAGAGIVQGLAFTPVENVVRLLQQSATSLTSLAARFLHLPDPHLAPAPAGAQASAPANPVDALRAFLASDSWRRSRSWWTGWRWAVARDAASYAVFFAAFDVTRRLALRVKALMGGPIDCHWDNFVSVDLGHGAAGGDRPASAARVGVPGDGPGASAGPPPTPTAARVAQAATIVGGGVTAGLLAGFVGRPFRACQRIMQQAQADAASAASATATVRPASSAPSSSTRAGPVQVGSGPRAPAPRTPHRAVRGWSPILRAYRAHGLAPFVRADSAAPVPPVTSGPALRRIATRIGWRVAAVGPWGLGFLVWAWVGGEI